MGVETTNRVEARRILTGKKFSIDRDGGVRRAACGSSDMALELFHPDVAPQVVCDRQAESAATTTSNDEWTRAVNDVGCIGAKGWEYGPSTIWQ